MPAITRLKTHPLPVLAVVLGLMVSPAQAASTYTLPGTPTACPAGQSCAPGEQPSNPQVCVNNTNGNPCGTDSGPASQTSSTGQNVGAGNPLNLLSGNKYQKEIDMPALPGILGLEIVRHYNSQRSAGKAVNGILGRGWRLSYETELYVVRDTVQIVQADGARIIFNRDPKHRNLCASLDPARGKVLTRKTAQGEEYVWVWPNGRKLSFSHQGKLTQIAAPSGEFVALTHDPNGNLVKVTDPQGRTLNLSYYDRRLPNQFHGVQHIDSPLGRTSFTYGSTPADPAARDAHLAIANLTQVSQAGSDGQAITRQYHYEDQKFPTYLTGITLTGTGSDGKALNQRLATYGYDEAGRANLSVRGPKPTDGKPGPEQVSLDFTQPGKTVLTNSLGQKTVYLTALLGSERRILEARGPGCANCGETNIRYRYDAQGRLTVATTLDLQGQPLTATQHDFDAASRPIKETRYRFIAGKPQPVAWTRYEYATTATQAQVEATAATFTLPDPQPTRFARPSLVPGQEHQTRVTYNDRGQPLTITETGYAPAVDDIAKVSRGGTAPGGQTQAVPITRTLTYRYQIINGRSVLAEIDGPLTNGPKNDPSDSDITRIEWDGRGSFINATVAPGGLRNTLDYDSAGLIARVQNDAGLATTFAYNANLQRTQISRTSPGSTSFVQHVDYDALGNLTQLSHGEGEQMRPQMAQAVDAQGRLRWRASALGFLQTWQYDTEGQLLETTRRNGSQQQVLAYRYNDAGQLVSWTDNAGRDRHLRYDDNGRPTAYIDALGREVAPLAGAGQQRHWRDDFGRLLASATPDTGLTRREFDAANRLVAMTDATGNHARYQYDAQGRIARQTVTDLDTKQDTLTEWRYQGRHLVELRYPGQSERYTYDPHGWRSARIVTLDTPQGEHTAITRYEHDANGQLVATTLPDGSRIRYERNGQGQVVALTRNRIATSWLRWLGKEETVASDIERDLVGLSGYTAGNGIQTRYQRSLEGTLARVVHRASGTRPLIQAHRLDPATLAALLPSQTLERLLGIAPAQAQTGAVPPRLTLEKPATESANPAALGALGLPADPQALIDHRYLWDAEGNLLYQRQAHPGQIQHASQAYDAHDRLIASVRRQEATPGVQRVGNNGQPAEQAEQTSSAFWRYAYDNQQRQVLSQQGAPRQDDTTTGTKRIEHAADSHRLKDARYRADGLPTHIGTRAYAWNPLGRLTEVRDTAQGTLLARYGYDHRGLRNAKEVDGRTTRYLYGESRELIAELDQHGHILRQYLYLGDQPLALIDSPEGRALGQDGGLAQAIQDLGTAVSSWFGEADLVWLHLDHLGAPEVATDGQGQALWRADYAPFGNARTAAAERTGRRFVLNLRLPGQYHDQETGLHYNRARYYDPEQGQYLSPDPLGNPDGPNPYAYVAFNPLRYVDADGLVLFAFDGTGNSDRTDDPAMAGSGFSNVVHFRDAYDSGDAKYVSGVGTVHYDEELGDIRPEDYATGKLLYYLTPGDPVYVNDMGGNYSGAARIDRMMKYFDDAAKALEDKDKAMDIDIVGFSRGAAEARDFANRIVAATTNGWYKYEDTDKATGKKVPKCQKVNFRFMGLFDTVLSTNFSGYSYNLAIPKEFAYVAQAVALNEHRSGNLAAYGQRNPRPHSQHWGGFPLESIGASNTTEGQIRIEQGFIGAHADIGGGYPTDQQGLSTVALNWMVKQAGKAGVTMDSVTPIPTGSVVLHDQSNVIRVGDPRTLIPVQAMPSDPPVYDYVLAEDRDVHGAPAGDQQRAMNFGKDSKSMVHSDTLQYITWLPRDIEQLGKGTPLDPRKLGNVTGSVDMKSYLEWLRAHDYDL